jgi:hypothetical protein
MDLHRRRIHEIFGEGSMTALDETITKRIGKLMRMFGSSYEPEAHTALRKMKGLLEAEGLTFNDLATVIENHQGEIEERKYSDADAEIIFAKGMEKGRVEEARKKDLPPEFYDADGHPQWNAIALFCQKGVSRLRDEWERTFINDMAGKTMWREPSEKQAKHLLAIFVRLGGRYDPKAVLVHF